MAQATCVGINPSFRGELTWRCHFRFAAYCLCAPARLLRQHFHHHESNIIHRLDVTAKRGEALADRARDLSRRAVGTLADHFAQAALAVVLALRVRHFPDAVGADEENLTGP